MHSGAVLWMGSQRRGYSLLYAAARVSAYMHAAKAGLRGLVGHPFSSHLHTLKITLDDPSISLTLTQRHPLSK
jgi:hypothetical protein